MRASESTYGRRIKFRSGRGELIAYSGATFRLDQLNERLHCTGMASGYRINSHRPVLQQLPCCFTRTSEASAGHALVPAPATEGTRHEVGRVVENEPLSEIEPHHVRWCETVPQEASTSRVHGCMRRRTSKGAGARWRSMRRSTQTGASGAAWYHPPLISGSRAGQDSPRPVGC